MWLHYGARYYDPQLGRWWSVDLADELYSPYSYVLNNPFRNTDKDGKYLFDEIDYNTTRGKILGEAARAYAATDEGYNQLAKYAKKGTSIFGRTFDSDGEYSEKAVFFKLKNITESEWGETIPYIENLETGEKFKMWISSSNSFFQRFDISINSATGIYSFFHMADAFYHEMKHVLLFSEMIGPHTITIDIVRSQHRIMLGQFAGEKTFLKNVFKNKMGYSPLSNDHLFNSVVNAAEDSYNDNK